MTQFDNANPVIYQTKERTKAEKENAIFDDAQVDEIDAGEIFDLIRDINDPEHPLTLEQLNVVQEELIKVEKTEREQFVHVKFTPTIPHCSMATLIGLAIRVKLFRSLHPRVKVIVSITPGTHNTEDAINRQLRDKERVAAAMENSNLIYAVNKCLTPRD